MDFDEHFLNDLLKKKKKYKNDHKKLNEYADICFKIGSIYYEKGYYDKALAEYDESIHSTKSTDITKLKANIHRYLGETLIKLGENIERAQYELDNYYQIAVKLNDIVEIQRAHITLGNYFMNLPGDEKYSRIDYLNKAYTHYLKSFDLLNEIENKHLVEEKEFALIKARVCLNCALVLDERGDEFACNEYLKTAINITESRHFYEDLCRCWYIKCEQAKRNNQMNECFKIAENIIKITEKSNDYVQQSNDYLLVAEIYLSVNELEKARDLLQKAYKLKKKCFISKEVKKKLKNVTKAITIKTQIKSTEDNDSQNFHLLCSLYDKLGDLYCKLGKYEFGLDSYKKQLSYANLADKEPKELAVIFSSIAQTFQDLDNYEDALQYYKFELEQIKNDYELAAKSLLNIAEVKEKLNTNYDELYLIYMESFNKSELTKNKILQLKILRQLKELQSQLKIDDNEIEQKIKNFDQVDEEMEEENESSDSSFNISSSEDEAVIQPKKPHTSRPQKIKRNIRGETPLHVACIKGNYELVKELVESGHPINERDNFKWLPIHEACNYGHLEIVKLLLKHGANYDDKNGPITPLHDASQNGHFDVVIALLDAGANPHIFTDDGFTPLDYLCKYKKLNEDSLDSHELASFEKAFEIMYKKIKLKNPNYKIKTDFEIDNDKVIEESTTSSEQSCDIRTHLLSSDLSPNKSGVSEYREAMRVIGSKLNTRKFNMIHKTRKTAVISEEEFKSNDEWLENDMNKIRKSTNSSKRKSTKEHTLTKSPKSKKRFISSNDEDNEIENININSTNNHDRLNSIDMLTLVDNERSLSPPIPIMTTPTKSQDIPLAQQAHQRQASLSPTTMDFEIIKEKRAKHKKNDISNFFVPMVSKPKLEMKQPVKINPQSSTTTNTKFNIKALIENKSLLIPISTVDSTIDELKEQILSRYKLLFSHEPKYREPEKVILQNSEGCILFGGDLVKDILADVKEVQVIVEKWKEEPKIWEKYSTFNKNYYQNILDELKLSETTKTLNLNNQFLSSNNLRGIFVNNRQYMEALQSIDLSSNLLDDQFFNEFFILYENFVNLRSLNISNNQITSKSIEALLNGLVKAEERNRLVLESLDLSSNCLGNKDDLELLTLILSKLELKNLSLSDCEIDFSNDDCSNRINGFFGCLKSKINDYIFKKFELNEFLSQDTPIQALNISHNKMSIKFLISLLEILSQKNEFYSLNMEKCLCGATEMVANAVNDFLRLKKDTLQEINLSYFNFTFEISEQIIKLLSECKNLKSLSYSGNYISSYNQIILLQECNSLEKLVIIGEPIDSCIVTSIKHKLVVSHIPLRHFSFKYNQLSEFLLIKNQFKQKWSSSLHVSFLANKIVQLFV